MDGLVVPGFFPYNLRMVELVTRLVGGDYTGWDDRVSRHQWVLSAEAIWEGEDGGLLRGDASLLKT